MNTAELYTKHYMWYYMPATVHKILIHGGIIIEQFGCIPIGELSEEAQEARNKDFKRYRLNNTGKFSREITNRDLINILLVSSDPLITSKRNLSNHYDSKLSEETKSLLKENTI